MDIRSLIRTVPDYPKPGIQFRDITSLLEDPKGLHAAVQGLADPYRGERIDRVAGIEARGFLFGVAVALELSAGFVPVRKEGKLPGTTPRLLARVRHRPCRDPRRRPVGRRPGTDRRRSHRDGRHRPGDDPADRPRRRRDRRLRLRDRPARPGREQEDRGGRLSNPLAVRIRRRIGACPETPAESPGAEVCRRQPFRARPWQRIGERARRGRPRRRHCRAEGGEGRGRKPMHHLAC